MAIITISQGTFSGARMLSHAVAQRLGYRCIDRDHVIAKAAQWGISEQDLRTAFEKPPSFFGQSQHMKYVYLSFIQAALTEEVRNGDVVYDGLGGQLLLGKGQHVLRTFITAPMEFRVNMVEFRRNCSRKDAIAYIDRMDEERRKWTQFLYGVNWTDPSLYDLVLNLEQMTLIEACDSVCLLAQSVCFQPTAETQRDLRNLAIASRVKANLAMHQATSDLQIDIAAEAGRIFIKGAIDAPDQARKIRSIAEQIPGVREVVLKELTLVTRM